MALRTNSFIFPIRISVTTLVLASALNSPATAASTSGNALNLPDFTTLDTNHVDVMAGKPSVRIPTVSIGTGASSLQHSIAIPGTLGSGTFRYDYAPLGYDSYSGSIERPPALLQPSPFGTVEVLATFGFQSERFKLVNGVWTPYSGQGSTLVDTGTAFVYHRADGVVLTYTRGDAVSGGLREVRYPDGRVITIKAGTKTRSVSTNTGLQLKYEYGSDGSLTRITAINNAYTFCDPVADTCATSGWPHATFAWSVSADVKGPTGEPNVLTVTDAGDAATRLTIDEDYQIARLRFPFSSVDNVSYSYCSSRLSNCWVASGAGLSTDITIVSGVLLSATVNGAKYNYDFYSTPNVGNYYSQSTGQSADGGIGVLKRLPWLHGPLLDVGLAEDSYQFEESDRNVLVGYTKKGEVHALEYDARGNVTKDTIKAAANSGLTDVARTAGYDATCTNLVTCNKPNWIKDANQNQTDFVYDPVHGGVLKEAMPAVNGVRPEKRYTYTQRRAWFLNAGGAYVASPDPIWLVSSESYCRTSAANAQGVCAVAGDEVRTDYYYGPDAGPNNLFLRGTTVTADGVSRTTCFQYDRLGNKISETSPRAGLTSCP